MTVFRQNNVAIFSVILLLGLKVFVSFECFITYCSYNVYNSVSKIFLIQFLLQLQSQKYMLLNKHSFNFEN